jgi:hypothetical protein
MNSRAKVMKFRRHFILSATRLHFLAIRWDVVESLRSVGQVANLSYGIWD